VTDRERPLPELEPWNDLDTTRIVLDSIRLHEAASRADVVRQTGLARAAVSQRVASLVTVGLLEEYGNGQSTGGRPPRGLRFRSEAGHILVADLGATSIDVAIADLSARIIAHASEPADVALGPEVVLSRVDSMFDDLYAATTDPIGPLRGVGLGIPGPVEFSSGRPISPPIMPGWDRYPVRERFEARHGSRVWVDNDVNVMGIGEWRSGVSRGYRNVVWLKIGTGIGAGLISDGLPHRGAQGAAGDVGHIQVVDEGVVCRCGNIGCLEALAGGAALGRDAEIAAHSGKSSWLAAELERQGLLTAESVSRGARHGDPSSVELLQRSGRLIGHMLASVVNLFNPSLIVIGGGVAQAGDVLLATIRETVYRRSLPLATRELQVLPTSLGEMAGVVGAAAMVADELFARENLSATLASEGTQSTR
jgi:glucokinase-like ROK family protein